MNNFGIAKPCSENWDNMNKNATGAFCQSCQKNVIDFTSMTNPEINRTLLSFKGAEICGRILPKQVRSMNSEFESWQIRDKRSFQSAFLLTLIVVFGFSLFSCSDDKQKQEIQQIRENVIAIVNEPQEIQNSVTKPVEAVLYNETEVVGVMDYPEVIVTKNPDFIQEPEIVDDEYYGYAGGMRYSTEYIAYIEETVIVADEYDESGNLIPKEFSALAFPNPTQGLTTLELKLPKSDDFTILLMDMSGKTLQAIHSGKINKGSFRTQTDLSEFPAGTYFIGIVSGSYKEVVKVIRL